MKLEDYYGSYLEGLLNMASSISKSIGPSFVKVDCYKKETFKKEFTKFYNINEELELIESSNSLDTTLLSWFNNEKEIVESITYWFNIKLSDNKKIYLPEEKIINILDNEQKDFYSLEDLFFIECQNYIFVFLLGNNE